MDFSEVKFVIIWNQVLHFVLFFKQIVRWLFIAEKYRLTLKILCVERFYNV